MNKHQVAEPETESISLGICHAHSGICVNVKRSSADIQSLWDAHDKVLESIVAVNKTIESVTNKMLLMLIGAMGSFIAMCVTWVFNNYLHFAK